MRYTSQWISCFDDHFSGRTRNYSALEEEKKRKERASMKCMLRRGVSFAIGQTGNWQTVTTLPNILRQFNPRFAKNGDMYHYNLNQTKTCDTPGLREGQQMLVVNLTVDQT